MWDNMELSEDEQNEADEGLESSGDVCCLTGGDIEDIQSNLIQQISNFTEDQLYEAISYYWNNDAFIKF